MTTESEPTPAPDAEGPAGLLLSRDLIFTSKVTGTARLLGGRVVVAGNSALAVASIERLRPKVVFVDLGAGNLVNLDALRTYQGVAGAGVPFVAFGSHVDTEALAAARSAGCDPVLARSRFTADLPNLMRRYLFGEVSPR
ncbi:MAG: response regulator [Isosphaeraceae bacterium]